MGYVKSIRAPTTASLPNNLRIPSTTSSLIKTLSKLSRQALINLALLWLSDLNISSIPPYLHRVENNSDEDEDTLTYPAAKTVEEARQIYEDFQDRKGGKREVLERILEGEWRHGITLQQLAMVDLRYMDDHPASLRWTALELSRIDTSPQTLANVSARRDWSGNIPRIQAATFVRNLQRECSPLVKAHYHIARSSTLPLTILRIFIIDSPYQYPRHAPETFSDSSRVVYVAFPDSCPFIYTSITASTGSKQASPSTSSTATDSRSLQRLVREAIPKALSRPQERYTLKATALAAKNLPTLLALRGPGRSTAANGAFSIFADAALEGSPLDPRPSNTVSAEEYIQGGHWGATSGENKENAKNADETPVSSNIAAKRGVESDNSASLSPMSKKRRLAVHSRFGTAASSSTPAPLDRLDIRLLDRPTSDDDEDGGGGQLDVPAPSCMTLTFLGSDVIGGIRRLAELGIVDPERVPSWLTGEEAISTAVVCKGRRVQQSG